MGRKCSVFDCNGNYSGQPYTRVVKFPKDEIIRNQWIDAMPNPQSQLEKNSEIMLKANPKYIKKNNSYIFRKQKKTSSRIRERK